MTETLSDDGVYYTVRSCTVRHGVVIEAWFGKDQRTDRIMREIVAQIGPEATARVDTVLSKHEPATELFIPGDIKDAVARLILETRCEIGREDDPMLGKSL
jgi:hypothetical protein